MGPTIIRASLVLLVTPFVSKCASLMKIDRFRGSTVAETFEALYAQQLKEVFKIQAHEQIDKGADALVSSRAYAEQGKPEFTLAFLLLADLSEDEKREL